MEVLKGKVALVTGAAGGIGRELVSGLAREGAAVVVNDVNATAASQLATDIISDGGRAIASDADVRDSNAIGNLVRDAITTFGGIDILINNAGIWFAHTGKKTNFVDSDEATWDWVLDVNLKGALVCSHAVLSGMVERQQGKIINLGSVAGVCGLPHMVDYAASKGAVIAMTKALAIEVGRSNVQVNCISPGSIDTGGGSPQTILGRPGTPQDVTELALFLASSKSDFITGQNYIIDGGRVLSTQWSDV